MRVVSTAVKYDVTIRSGRVVTVWARSETQAAQIAKEKTGMAAEKVELHVPELDWDDIAALTPWLAPTPGAFPLRMAGA